MSFAGCAALGWAYYGDCPTEFFLLAGKSSSVPGAGCRGFCAVSGVDLFMADECGAKKYGLLDYGKSGKLAGNGFLLR
jgi:hypothetical protein